MWQVSDQPIDGTNILSSTDILELKSIPKSLVIVGGGFIKLVVDNKSDKILGCQIIGPHATELIAEISVCVQFGITSEKLASVIHAHPTLSEIICEVSEAVHNKAIHST